MKKSVALIAAPLLAAAVSAFTLASAANATIVTVSAHDNSSSGGAPLDTGINLSPADILTVSVALDDLWSAGGDSPCTRTSNADGLTACYGQYHQGNLTANYGSLVGLINGAYYDIGTAATLTGLNGELFLAYWDSNNSDNTGSVDVTLNFARTAQTPEPGVLALFGFGLLGLARRARA